MNHSIKSVLWFLILTCISGCLPENHSITIDLTNVCNKQNKSPDCIEWFVKKGFDSSLLALQKGDARFSKHPWIKPGNIEIWVNKVFEHPPDQTFEEYSFVTWFDYPQNSEYHNDIPGILFGEIGESFTVYINGHKIVTEGVIKNNEITYHRTIRGTTYPFRPDYLKDKNNQLMIHLAGDPRFEHTGFYVTRDYTIGSFSQISRQRRDLTGLMLIFVYFVTGLYHIYLYLKRTQEVSYKAYAFLSIMISLYLVTRHDIIFEIPLDTIIIQKIEFFILFIISSQLLYFLDIKLNLIARKLTYILYILNSILAISAVLLPIHLSEYVLKTWQGLSLFIYFPYSFFILIKAKMDKNADAGRLIFGMLLLSICAIFDVIDSLVLQTGITLAKYGMAMFVLGISATLANRFMQVHNEVEELNKNLEKKVEHRTRELSTTLNEVQDLKVKQDGDYFLTSLLLKPLNGNYSSDQNVDIEIYLKQNKEFQFKRWKTEIGGDICLAYDIKLFGRKYVCFINADAMGKSIQGAGGALVGGVVFKSVVTRTQLSKSLQNRLPEKWLKDCFSELQNTFVSFEGSMLLSAVVGLVDIQNGFTWFINSEHPFPVLYKNHKASFLGESAVIRKLGIDAIEKKLTIQTIQLEPNDILYLGSDGRDDIMISKPGEQKDINEDESLFCRHIENANGVLRALKTELEKSGELTDDLSLMRISFKEDAPLNLNAPSLETMEQIAILQNDSSMNAAVRIEKLKIILENHPDLAEAAYAIAVVAQKSGDHVCSREYLYKCIALDPGNIKAITKIIFASKKLRDYKTAIDFGEALRLRGIDPRHSLALADSYRLDENNSRARKILDEIKDNLSTDPDYIKLDAMIGSGQ